jgi:small-conductance mechanosensitive channel
VELNNSIFPAVLKKGAVPQAGDGLPIFLVMEYAVSAVNLELRIWIDDPKNGIHNDKDAALMAVWDSFQASGIEIAFPQRDLHIKSTVPLEISQNSLRPLAKNSPTNWYRSPDIRVL